MKLHHVPQGSLEWLMLRAGIPTASEMDALITPKFKVKTGDGPQTYLAKKVAEYWQGGPLPTFQGFDMDQGQILEGEAIPWYELEHGRAVERIGFITTDDGRVGCSPDGILGLATENSKPSTPSCGLEIKCPAAHTHTAYLLDGELPDEYAIQVHASMYVTGFSQWQFLSYRRGFPQLIITVERNEEYQETIAEALDLFLQKFDDAKARLTELNGGPPRRLTPMPPRNDTITIQRPTQKPLVNIDEVIP